jgi:hypothetical protein
MRLSPATDFMTAVGFDQQISDYVNAVDEALDTATLQLINDLRTEFDRLALVDYYEVDPNDPFTKLKLSQGFVQPSPAPVVIYATSASAWSQGARVDISPICKIDYDKGVVWVSGSTPTGAPAPISDPEIIFPGLSGISFPGYFGLKGAMLSVSYTAGLEVDGTDADLYDQTQVPKWLQQLSRLTARIMLVSHPALQVTGVTPDSKPLIAQYSGIVSRKTRYVPSGILPKMSIPA